MNAEISIITGDTTKLCMRFFVFADIFFFAFAGAGADADAAGSDAGTATVAAASDDCIGTTESSDAPTGDGSLCNGS